MDQLDHVAGNQRKVAVPDFCSSTSKLIVNPVRLKLTKRVPAFLSFLKRTTHISLPPPEIYEERGLGSQACGIGGVGGGEKERGAMSS